MSSGFPGGAPALPASTILGEFWPAHGADGPARWLRVAALMLAGSAVLAVSAKVQVPFHPVPMTLQTLAVLVLGAAYGWRLGAATVLLYLAQGFAGLPVFAGPLAGPAYFMGPTAGFLIGFVAAAALTGRLAERGWDRSLPRVVALTALGHAVIFAFGLSWLGLHLGWAKAVGVGFLPFVWATLLKTALAAALLQGAWSVARR